MGIGWSQRPVQVQAISIYGMPVLCYICIRKDRLEQTAHGRELSELHGERAHSSRLSLIDSFIPSVTLSCAHLFIKSPSCPIPGALICTVFYIKSHPSTSGRIDIRSCASEWPRVHARCSRYCCDTVECRFSLVQG